LGARKIPITQCDEPNELVTPTGAALLAEFAERFEPMTGIVAEKIGFGLGTRDNQTRPNVLRAVLGTSARDRSSATTTLGNQHHVTRHPSRVTFRLGNRSRRRAGNQSR
jgi:uncharacterized protein (DUF111 family)